MREKKDYLDTCHHASFTVMMKLHVMVPQRPKYGGVAAVDWRRVQQHLKEQHSQLHFLILLNDHFLVCGNLTLNWAKLQWFDSSCWWWWWWWWWWW